MLLRADAAIRPIICMSPTVMLPIEGSLYIEFSNAHRAMSPRRGSEVTVICFPSVSLTNSAARASHRLGGREVNALCSTADIPAGVLALSTSFEASCTISDPCTTSFNACSSAFFPETTSPLCTTIPSLEMRSYISSMFKIVSGVMPSLA